MSRLMTEVEVTCLPKDLPQAIEVDIESLQIGEAIHFSDLSLPDGVKLTALLRGGDESTSVVQVLSPKGLEEDEEDSLETEDASEEIQRRRVCRIRRIISRDDCSDRLLALEASLK